jgi:hypothetical protein
MNYFEMNRESWNQRAEVHFDSSFYDVEGFLAGKTSLREIELTELTEVNGLKLLHLQCHFGLDTLSWARLGAECTGVDISPVAIAKAQQLNQQTQLDAKFICTDVYSYQRGDAGPFDIVNDHPKVVRGVVRGEAAHHARHDLEWGLHLGAVVVEAEKLIGEENRAQDLSNIAVLTLPDVDALQEQIRLLILDARDKIVLVRIECSENSRWTTVR